MLVGLANRETGGTTVLRVLPGGDNLGNAVIVTGARHEVDAVNLYHRAKIFPGTVGLVLLGDLGKHSVIEVFLGRNHDLRGELAKIRSPLAPSYESRH